MNSDHPYLTLKIRTQTKEYDPENQYSDHETTINEYLKSNPIEHPGKNMVRRVLDSFEKTSPN